LGVRPSDAFFWGTHAGPELDLVISRKGKLHGYEIKRTSSPRVTPSLINAWEALELDSLTLIHGGSESFTLGNNVRALSCRDILESDT